ncbi:hypothetical protein B484DRAFT_409181 [Ochromonadaceae sp. CCMP2298]|nr:hypothetical protein B484DRAFT_409181 [Ochromonadaceae sp. CCMP2298]
MSFNSGTLPWLRARFCPEQQEQIALLALRADAILAESTRLLAVESPMSRADSRSWETAARECKAEAARYRKDCGPFLGTSPRGTDEEAPEDGTDVEADISALSMELSQSPHSIGETGICDALSWAFSAPKGDPLPSVVGLKRAAQGPASPQAPENDKENDYVQKRAPRKGLRRTRCAG